MKRLMLLFAPLMWGAMAEGKEVIENDKGGSISHYAAKYESWRNSGTNVEVRGICISACTLVLAYIPRERICVTKEAAFMFHSASTVNEEKKMIHSKMGTLVLWQLYAQNDWLYRWLIRNGGLSPTYTVLQGDDLRSMYKECEPEN